jgi:hypothetical protein
MQYFRGSTEAVGGNSQSDHLFRLAQIVEIQGIAGISLASHAFFTPMRPDVRRCSKTPGAAARPTATAVV